MAIAERVINASRRAFVARSFAGCVALTLPLAAAQHRRLLMEMTIRPNSGVITLINIFAVNPENQQRLVAVLKDGTEAIMSKRAGYISASIHVSKDGRHVINYSQWKSVMDIEAMRQDPDVGPYMRRVANFGTFEAIACEVSYLEDKRVVVTGGQPRARAGYCRGAAGSRGAGDGSRARSEWARRRRAAGRGRAAWRRERTWAEERDRR